MLLHLTATVPVLIWLYLLFARGGFWRVRQQLDSAPFAPTPGAASKDSLSAAHPAPSGEQVVVVIPARDEAATIGRAVDSLWHQDYPGSLLLIVVDDGSTDGTEQAARAAAAAAAAASAAGADKRECAPRRLELVRATSLPPGWTGKLWALSQGVQIAEALDPDFLLFTDADIQHGRGHIAGLVARAQAEQRDLVSAMVMLSVGSWAERWLIPAFVFFFFKLYPPRWIASPRWQTAGAAGGCMLIRLQALQRIGGVAAVRSQLIDDCSLAQAIKRTGGRIWLGLTRQAWSLRPYGSLAHIGRMISRSAFNQLRHSYLLLAGTLLGLCCTYLLPPLLLFAHDPWAIGLGAAAWALMTLTYLPMVRFYGLSPLWSLTLPAIAAFYSAATVHSALQYRRGRGGSWKGRVQDVRG